jgi:hypothetical protein
MVFWGEVAIMDKRTEYIERLSAHMLEWDSQIRLLSDKSENAAPETKLEYSAAIAELQHKRDEVAQKLQGISDSTDDEWEELKTGTEHALHDIRAVFFSAVTRLV